MKKYLFLCFIFCGFAFVGKAQSFLGSWAGDLALPSAKLKVVFHLKNSDNVWSGTMDSPNQGAFGIPIQTIKVVGDSLFVADARIAMQYKGKLEINQIKGIFKQGNFAFTLNLLPQQATQVLATIARPQTPVPPFDYRTEELLIPNSAEQVTLAGTLTLPKDGKKAPLLILISGSGPQDRDETIFNHKPFAVLADFFTKNGYAVFRFDDRGVGKSTGDFNEATSFNFASDVNAVVNALSARKDIDRKKMGLLGHSEGSLVAAIAAASNTKVGFIISLAGPGVSGDKLLLEQTYLVGKGAGLRAEVLSQNKQVNAKLYEAIIAQNWTDFDESATLVVEQFKALQPELQHQRNEDLIQNVVPKNIKWFKTFLTTDPAYFYSQLKIPVLAINGENDIQVSYTQNLPALQASFKNKKSKTQSFPNLNHLFQTSKTQTLAEYNEISETFAPIVLQTILDWLKINKL